METMSQVSSSGHQLTNNLNLIELNGWTEQHEEIFVEWADKAMCYRWLHSRSYKIFSFRNACYTIPVIIMSTISGTASFAQDKFPPNYKVLAQMIIGSINIIAGILTTIQQFLKVTQYCEAHRVSAISWGKFSQNIKVELTKNPKDREQPMEMLKSYKEEFDRLIEISPDIEDSVVAEFQKKFGKNKEAEVNAKEINSRFKEKFKELFHQPLDIETNGELLNIDDEINKTFNDYNLEMKKIERQKAKNPLKYLKKPDVCDELVSTNEVRRNWYNTKDKETIVYEDPEQIREIERRKEREIYKRQIDDFKNKYQLLQGRMPFDTEITDNLKDVIPVNVVESILKELNHQD